MPRLLLTRQACVDLGIDAEAFAGVDAADVLAALRDQEAVAVSRSNVDVPATVVGVEADRRVGDEYGPLVAFVRMRSQAPEGQEYTQKLPQNYKRVYNLHAGEDRAVTWWDRERDIVWLLATGFHRSGQRDDFYPRVVQMDGRGELMPTGDDFFAAEISPDEQFITELARHGRELVAEAREHPGTEHARTVVSRARMGAHVELLVDADDRAEELWLAGPAPRGLPEQRPRRRRARPRPHRRSTGSDRLPARASDPPARTWRARCPVDHQLTAATSRS